MACNDDGADEVKTMQAIALRTHVHNNTYSHIYTYKLDKM